MKLINSTKSPVKKTHKPLVSKKRGGKTSQVLSMFTQEFVPEVISKIPVKTKHIILKPIINDNINPFESPFKITYTKLIEIFYDELLYYEAIKLGYNVESIVKEIVQKLKEEEGDKVNLTDYSQTNIEYIFDTTIQSKINESIQHLKNPENKIIKELLTKKLLNVFYTANYGYNYNSALKGGGHSKQSSTSNHSSNPSDNHSSNPSGKPSKSRGINKQSYYDKLEKEWLRTLKNEEVPSLRQKITTLSSRFIFPYKNLLSNVYKRLWYFFRITDENKEPRRLLTDDWNNKREQLRDSIISSYKDDNEREKIRAEFEIIEIVNPPINAYIRSDFIHMLNETIWERQLMDWRLKEYEKYPDSQKYSQLIKFKRKYINQWFDYPYMYRPFRYFPIYSINLKNKFCRKYLLGKFFYLINSMKDLTTFVDLQDCQSTGEVTGIATGCNPYDRDAMPEMFNLAVKILTELKNIDDRQRTYLSIPYFEDMKAGTIYSWNKLSDIPPLFNNAHVCFNYSSAKGGTAIVLLFLRLREARKQSEISLVQDIVEHDDRAYLRLISEEEVIIGLKNIHFGYRDIFEVIRKFKDLFKYLMIDYKYFEKNYDYSVYMKERKKADNMEHLVYMKISEDEDAFHDLVENDIFNTKFIWHVKLLRQRLIRIFYFLAKHHKIQKFYLYRSSSDSSNFPDQTHFYKTATYEDIKKLFSDPVEMSIDWKKIGAETWELHQNWVDGIIG